MASLDNFHTHNPAPQPFHRGRHPGPSSVGPQLYRYHLGERHAALQHALVAGTGKQEYWDYRNQIPIAPVQPVTDPLLLTGRQHPDPTYVERAHTGLNDNYVATRPRTHLQESGDTAEHKMLVQGTTCWRSRILNYFTGGGGRRSVARLNTYTRYHPYLGR